MTINDASHDRVQRQGSVVGGSLRWAGREGEDSDRMPVNRGTGVRMVTGPRAAYVVRAERTGVPTASFLAGGAVFSARMIRRLIRRDTTWTISVNAKENDPFGPPCHEELVATKSAVAGAMADVVAAIRRGEIPADQHD